MNLFKISIIFLTILALSSTNSDAEIVKFKFTGVVDNLNSTLLQEFSIGEKVVGTYKVDDTTLDASELQLTIGNDYLLTAQIGRVTVRKNIWFIVSFSGINSGINGGEVNGNGPLYFDIQLDDNDGLLEDNILPLVYPISEFGWDRSNINFPNDSNRLNFNVQSIEVDVPHTLSVNISGNGNGLVKSSPSGIHCPLQCEKEFPKNTNIILSATPDVGSQFKGWTGTGCAGTGNCIIEMTQSSSVGAVFSTEKANSGLSSINLLLRDD